MKYNEELRYSILTPLNEVEIMSPGSQAYAAWLNNMETHVLLHHYGKGPGTMLTDEQVREAIGHLEAVNYIIRDAAKRAATAMDKGEE